VLLWAVCFVLLLQRDFLVKKLDVREALTIEQTEQENYLGVYFNNERIGYVQNRFAPADHNSFLLRQQAKLRLNILGETHPVNMEVSAHLDRGYLLQDFEFSLQSPFYAMQATGKVSGDRVSFSLSTGKETVHDVVRLAAPPFLATNQRGYLLKKNLQGGDKVRIAFFDPVSLSGKETVLEYRGREKILIKGRIHQLHHFVELFSGLRINSWLDDEGQVVKEESPAGFVFLREPKFKAMDIKSTPSELLSSVSVAPMGRLPKNVDRLQRMRYRIANFDNPGEFDLAGGRQQFKGEVVTVRREGSFEASQAPCDDPAYLASDAYIQAKHPAIVKQAKEIVGTAKSPEERARLLANWVYRNLEKRPVLGIPDALSTLGSRRGDCNEHAALYAALARSVGIPTRLVAGVMLHEGAFYYHAWNEVCLAGRWCSVDTTRDQWPADLTHIRFVAGGVDAQIKISNLIGKLRIEILPPQEDK